MSKTEYNNELIGQCNDLLAEHPLPEQPALKAPLPLPPMPLPPTYTGLERMATSIQKSADTVVDFYGKILSAGRHAASPETITSSGPLPLLAMPVAIIALAPFVMGALAVKGLNKILLSGPLDSVEDKAHDFKLQNIEYEDQLEIQQAAKASLEAAQKQQQTAYAQELAKHAKINACLEAAVKEETSRKDANEIRLKRLDKKAEKGAEMEQRRLANLARKQAQAPIKTNAEKIESAPTTPAVHPHVSGPAFTE